MNDRKYVEFLGFQMDHDFLTHQGRCDRCREYDAGRPASISKLCLDGAILLKMKLAEEAPKKEKLPQEKDENWTTKKKAKALMVYK